MGFLFICFILPCLVDIWRCLEPLGKVIWVQRYSRNLSASFPFLTERGFEVKTTWWGIRAKDQGPHLRVNFSEEGQNAVNQIQLESRELLGQDFRRMTMKGESFLKVCGVRVGRYCRGTCEQPSSFSEQACRSAQSAGLEANTHTCKLWRRNLGWRFSRAEPCSLSFVCTLGSSGILQTCQGLQGQALHSVSGTRPDA